VGLKLRRGAVQDSTECGRVCFEAFKRVGDRHGFPHDFPSPEVASGLMSFLLAHPGFYGVVAEADGRIAGSNFMDERSRIAGIGPISVDPDTQSRGIGRQLMEDVLERARKQGFLGVRLAQSGYNNQTLCLYTKLGFRTREPLSLMSGPPPKFKLAGYDVRRASEADIAACNRLCRTVHGLDRAGELEDAVREKTATVVERMGRITGYATAVGFMAHAIGETNEDMVALIGAADSITGPGMLVPTRNQALLTWCLENELRLVQQMTYMTIGIYNEPAGAYLPSVLY
jgi:N-acetylglutamate synthase-like GNAT family acetyltransferase